MASNTERAKAIIDLDGKQAGQELDMLKAKAKQLKEELAKAKASNDLTSYKNLEKQLKSNETAQKSFTKAVFDTNNVLKNLSGSTLRDLQRAQRELSKEISNSARATIEEKNALAAKQNQLKQVKAEIDKVNGGMKSSSSTSGSMGAIWGNLGSIVGKVSGLLAGVFAVVKSGKAIIEVTDTVSDRWAETMGGVNSAFDYLKRSVATLDFSNFLTNIRAAIKAGRDYVSALDEIGDRQRSLAILESEDKKTIAQLTIASKDVTKTKQERILAATQVIDIEEKNAKRRVQLANDEKNLELKEAARKTGLSEKRVAEMLKESETNKTTVHEIKQFNEALYTMAKYNADKNSQWGFLTADKKGAKEALEMIKKAPEYIRNSSEEWLKFGKINEEQYNKLTGVIVKAGDEEASFYENTDKMQTRRNKLTKGQLDDEEKVQKSIEKSAKEVEKQATEYDKITNRITETKKQIELLALANQPIPNSLIHQLTADQAKLKEVENTVKGIADGLAKIGLKTITGIPTNKFEGVPDKLKPQAMPDMASPGATTGFALFGQNLKEQLKDPAQLKEAALTAAQTTETAIFDIVRNNQQAQFDHKMALLDKQKEAELSNKNLTEEQKAIVEAKYEAKAKKLKQDQFRKQKSADVIQSLINTALAVTKVLDNPVQAILTALAGAAQTAVIAAQPVPEFSTGGRTSQGADHQPAGIVHANEYVIPAWERRLPHVMAMENVIESIRQRGYASGGPTTSAGSRSLSEAETNRGGGDAFITAITRFSNTVDQLQKDGLYAKLVYQDFKLFENKVTQANTLTN